MNFPERSTGRGPLALLACVAALGSASAASAAILHVPADLPTIQAGIDAAAEGDTVLVAPGLYFENLSIWYKQISLESEAGADKTIIDGQGLDNTLFLYHLPGRQSTRVSGFTIRNGKAIRGSGGGIVSIGGADVIENNVIFHNWAYIEGGGISLAYSYGIVQHNRIVGNASRQWAGGLGSSDGSPTIVDNVFEDNHARGNGGALSVASEGSPLILRNEIRRNDANVGGAIYVTFGSRARFSDNLLHDNVARSAGGGAFITLVNGTESGRWVNNTIADNMAPSGTQVFVEGVGRNVQFFNNAIVGPDTGAAVVCQSAAEEDSPNFGNNDVYAGGAKAAEGGCASTAVGGSNLSVAPAFVNGVNGRPYHLAADSPLVDAGSNDAVRHLHRDFGGRPRIVDGGHGAVVDIGAFEYVPK
jgi:hypothetical protein